MEIVSSLGGRVLNLFLFFVYNSQRMTGAPIVVTNDKCLVPVGGRCDWFLTLKPGVRVDSWSPTL